MDWPINTIIKGSEWFWCRIEWDLSTMKLSLHAE